MTETFGHPDDNQIDDQTEGPGHDEPGYQHDEPSAPEDSLLDADLDADAPELALPGEDIPAEHDPGTAAQVWHTDPAVDDDLRQWLDNDEPALDPPPGFERQLAEGLSTEADRHGTSVDDLVRDVLDRLGRS